MSIVKKSFLLSMPLGIFALVLNLGFKTYLATIVSKDILALFFTALDIFALSLLILVGFRSSMVVTYAKTKEDVKILNIFRFFLMVAILLSWAFLIPYLKHQMGVNIDYWYLVATLLAMALWTYLGNEISMYRMYGVINYATILEPLFTISWFLIAWYVYSIAGLQSLFIATIMGSLTLSSFLIYSKYKKHLKEPPLKLFIPDDKMKLFLKNSIISTIEFGSGIVMIYVAVVLLLNYHTQEDLGNFQVVVKPVLMGLIAIFVFPIFRFFLPEFSKLVAKKDLSSVKALKNWYVNLIALVSLSLIVTFLLWGREITLFLFPVEYESSYLLLTHLLFFFPFIGVNALQLAVLKAFGKFSEALFIRVLGVVIFLVSFYIIRLFSTSVVDVVMGLSIGYFGMFFVSFFIEKRVLKGV